MSPVPGAPKNAPAFAARPWAAPQEKVALTKAQVDTMRGIVVDLLKVSTSGATDWFLVLEIAKSQGMGEIVAEDALNELVTTGGFYEPTLGVIRKVD